MTLLRWLLSLHKRGFIAVAALGSFSGCIQAFAYKSLAGSTATAHRAFGQQMQSLGSQLTYLLPVPLRVDTLAGYVEWRGLGSLPLIFGFWAVLSGAGGTRGDEERGLLETWLASGVPRWRLLSARFAAFGLAALGAVLTIAICTELGAVGAGSPLPFSRLIELLLLDAIIALWCYGFTALVAQFTAPSRLSAGIAGVVLLALYLLNGLGRAAGSGLAQYRAISPFYYVDRTTALVPGGTFDGAAAAGLAASACMVAALAVLAFVARDCGATAIRRARPARPPVVDPDPNPLLCLPILAPLFEQRIGILSWAAGLLVLSAFLTSLVKTVVKAMRDGGGFGNYLAEVERHANVDQAFIGVFVLPVMQLLLAVYAIVCVARWSADDAEGRLAMMLSAPVTRRRVVLERAAALLVGTVVIVAAGMLGAAVVASAQHLGVDDADLVRAGALLLPFTLAYGAAGAAIGGASPRLAVPLLTAVAAASYFLQQVTQLFKWPSWLSNLSVFQLYGDPLDNGVFWGGLVALFAIVCAGFAAGVVSLQRRDLAG